MSVTCPLECLEVACGDEPWVGWVSVMVAVSIILSLLLTYLLRSRCVTITCGCIRCDRDPVKMEAASEPSVTLATVMSRVEEE
mgnify:CR=1 FL=1